MSALLRDMLKLDSGTLDTQTRYLGDPTVSGSTV